MVHHDGGPPSCHVFPLDLNSLTPIFPKMPFFDLTLTSSGGNQYFDGMRNFFYFFLRLFKGTAEYDDERNPKLYLVEAEVPTIE
jgi:hypothetical protein